MTKPATIRNNKYNVEHYEILAIRVKKGYRDIVKQEAEKDGKSMAQWVVEAIEEKRRGY